MILNNQSFPCVYSNRVEYKNHSTLWRVKDYTDFDYWQIDVYDNVTFIDIIPNDIIQKVKSDNQTYFLLSCPFEAYLFLIELIYRDLVGHLEIDPHKIILYSENRYAYKEVERISNQYKLEKIQVYWSLIFEFGVKQQLKQNLKLFYDLKTLEKKNYSKKFLNFNRRWRIHRPLVVALLHAKHLLDKGNVSLASGTVHDPNWGDVFDVFLDIVKYDNQLLTLLNNNRDRIFDLPPLYLDTKVNFTVNRPYVVEDDIEFDLTKYLYEETYFSLVSETYFFDCPGPFLTEKIFKPIAFKHPFILISGPNHLQYLKTIGYKTFHPYIDESYDDETDDVNRLKMILNETERLSNLSGKELYDFLDSVKPIVEHNFFTMIAKRNTSHLQKIVG